MKEVIGCALLELNEENLNRITGYKQILDKELLQGRQCLVIWEVKTLREKQTPFETKILDTFLEPASARGKEDQWVYFGNGAIRCYDNSNKLVKTYFWIMLLKKGPKAYKRIKSVTQDIFEKSRIPVDDYAFTRDVANNVWHLRSRYHMKTILDRFKNLASWADERILVVLPEGQTRRQIGQLDLGKDDIPKVEKVPVHDRLKMQIPK